MAAGRFLSDRFKAVQGVGKIMVSHDNVIQSLAKNTIQNQLLKFFSRTDVKCVGKEVVFHLSITIMLLFLHYCQCAVNNRLVLSVNLIRLQILLASTKHN